MASADRIEDSGALFARIGDWPKAAAPERWESDIAELGAAAQAQGFDAVAVREILDRPEIKSLLTGTFAGSPYLTGLARRNPVRLFRILAANPEEHFGALKVALGKAAAEAAKSGDQAAVMRALREFKSEVALLTALADLGGVWPVMTVTRVLTETADAALRAGVDYLFTKAAAKGEWIAPPDEPGALASGYIVLGMGKYGAGELNYSSDIDLIVFFDRDRMRVKDGIEPQTFFVRLTRELIKLIQEHTADGYVFRTDLRLRPDAGATQIAMSTDAAMAYYESFGQNWERAAFIKARAVAGDLIAGDALLRELQPFIWRKYLDFAAIADVHAMKRQINAFKGFGKIGVAGHNIKLGRGGIREIEFFTQTQQLIAGGRQRDLRSRQTLQTLETLAERGWIKDDVRTDLESAYCFLRRIEHRLQMVADEQTQLLPDDPERLERVALFSGYRDLPEFSAAMTAVLEKVQTHYAALFEDMPTLTGHGSNMVFAGGEDDPETVAALKEMGFSQPSTVIATVRGWHHGRYAAVRSPRSRERLTEVQPLLIEAFSSTIDPDAAIATFDRFLSKVPTGVQLFSLLRAHPALLQLVAHIMGSAPRLANVLSRRRRLLDAVLDPRTYASRPSADELDEVIATELDAAADFQGMLDSARIVGSEQKFLIGVRVLSGTIDASMAGGAYALIAERLIAALLKAVEEELAKTHGRVPGSEVAVIAMGKLGGREMTAASDLDLIVVYDYDPEAQESDGAKSLPPTQYFARLTQRLISALSAHTSEGNLYDVDMRLRPSGQQGPVATKLSSFLAYQTKEAWTWEHMALVRARVVATTGGTISARVGRAICDVLMRERDRGKIAADVREMRERVFAEKGSPDIWNLKHVRGGLVDLEFMAQFLELIHAHKHSAILDQTTYTAFERMREAGLIDARQADILLPATRLIHNLTQVLRICTDGRFDRDAAPLGLKELLARAGDAPTFAILEEHLKSTLNAVSELFDEIVS